MNECECKRCVDACRHTPGWFAPGEAEKAAEHLGIPFEEFKKSLIKDHCSNQNAEEAPYVWAPRKSSDREEDDIRTCHAQRVRGECVFLKDERCSIHAVKPFECRTILSCKYIDYNIRDKIEDMYRGAGYPLGERPPGGHGFSSQGFLGSDYP